MAEKQYFILRGKDREGPYSIETLKEIGVDGSSKVWYAGLDGWTKASELPELRDSFSIQPGRSSIKRFSALLILIVFLVAAGFTGFKLFSKSKIAVRGQLSSLGNQQLYKLYAPSVVLIEQRYMYELTAGGKKFYFNDYYGYDGDMGYLVGLTEDSLQAADRAEPLQGTGFFIGKEGKILTNRHVAKPAPSEDEQYQIQRYFFQSLKSSLALSNFADSIKKQKNENDSLLTVLLQDSANNAVQIATVKQKVADAEDIISEEDDEDGPALRVDSAAVGYLNNQTIVVRKVTLELRAFLPGTQNPEPENGIACTVIATSQDENVDLALMQTTTRALPDSSIKVVDLSRIRNSDQNDMSPQMSERLILIGYNSGTDLAKTTEGIEPQLTDGKVSQNTDAFRLMYTIPTLPGSSGSPVLDDRGRLVSVNFAGMSQTQSFNYGIQARQIKSFLTSNNISL